MMPILAWETVILLILMAVSIGLSIAAGVLAAQGMNVNRAFRRDDTPTSLSTRGSYAPLLLGKYRVGAIFGWAGDRKVKQEKVGEAGKGGGSSDITEQVYTEVGWHILHCGAPVEVLHQIYANGETIWTGPINSTTSPSGTTVQLGTGDSFTIYWGEYNQPINAVLGGATRVGIASRWPHLCYVVWNPKRLGGSPVWPQLEYLIETTCSGNALSDSDYILDDSTSSGVNPAHALAQLLTAQFPLGAGLSRTLVDNTSLEAMGVLMETEHLPLNMVFSGGPLATDAVGAILQDCGTFMPVIGGRLAFASLRSPTTTLPTITDTELDPTPVALEIIQGDRAIDRLLFSFVNENQNYREYDIKIDDDSFADANSVQAVTELNIAIATHGEPAAKIARRRMQEQLGDQSGFRLRVNRGFRLLTPGQAFESPHGRLRVTEVKRFDDRPNVELGCILDSYSIEDTNDPFAEGGGIKVILAVAPDIAFTFFELPTEITGSTQIKIAVLRVRAHQQIVGALVHGSVDGGTSYNRLGNQNYASAGGFLNEDFLDLTDVLENGPVFETHNDDILDVLDLSADTASWQNGRQVLVIEEEVMFLRNIVIQTETAWQASTAYTNGDYVVPTTPNGLRYYAFSAGTQTSGATEPDFASKLTVGEQFVDNTVVWRTQRFAYQTKGIIRARHGTTKVTHAKPKNIFIADSNRLNALGDAIMQPGENLCVKTQPYTFSDTQAISGVTAVCEELEGSSSPSSFALTSGGEYMVSHMGDRFTYVE